MEIPQGIQHRADNPPNWTGNYARIRNLKVKINVKEKRVHSIPVRQLRPTTSESTSTGMDATAS